MIKKPIETRDGFKIAAVVINVTNKASSIFWYMLFNFSKKPLGSQTKNLSCDYASPSAS
jgi:hypothetical protein